MIAQIVIDEVCGLFIVFVSTVALMFWIFIPMCIYNRDVNINDRIPKKTSMKRKKKNAFLQLNKKKE